MSTKTTLVDIQVTGTLTASTSGMSDASNKRFVTDAQQIALPVLDTGWTANTTTGDKTQVIPSSATLTTIKTALNALVSGAGDALFATAQKVAALEVALSTNKVPNA